MTIDRTIGMSEILHRAQLRFTLVSIACISIFFGLTSFFILRQTEIKSIEIVAHSIAFAGAPALRFDDKNAMLEIVAEYATRSKIARATFYDRNGKIWIDYEPNPTSFANRFSRILAAIIISKPVSAEIVDNGINLGLVQLRSDGTTIAYFCLGILIFSLSIIYSAVIAISIYSKRVTTSIANPLDLLATATRRLRTDPFTLVQAESSHVREINELANDFNALSQELVSQHFLILQNDQELRASNHRLHLTSRQDPLTKLSNRQYFSEYLASAIGAATASGHKVGVVFADADRFKSINDSLGHDAGDELLVEIARRLNSAIRSTDLVARIGGDEFVIVVSPLNDSNEITMITDRIVRAMGGPFRLAKDSVFSSLTIGVSIFPDHADDADALVRAADQAMYRAKAKSRGTVEHFSP